MFYVYQVNFKYNNGVSYDFCTEIIISPNQLNENDLKQVLYQQYDDPDGVITELIIIDEFNSNSTFDNPIIL